MKHIEPTEKTAPPFGVSMNVRSDRMMSSREAGQVWSRRSSLTGWKVGSVQHGAADDEGVAAACPASRVGAVQLVSGGAAAHQPALRPAWRRAAHKLLHPVAHEGDARVQDRRRGTCRDSCCIRPGC